MTTVDDYVRMLQHARMDRLDAEAVELLRAGYRFDDLVVVTSPVWPDSRVVTVKEMEQHQRELRDGTATEAAPLDAGWWWWR